MILSENRFPLFRIMLLRRVAPFQRGDEPILPVWRAANRCRQQFGPAIVEMTVGLPGEADAAMRLDVLLRREVESVSCGDSGGGAGDRQLRSAGGDGPGPVISVR